MRKRILGALLLAALCALLAHSVAGASPVTPWLFINADGFHCRNGLHAVEWRNSTATPLYVRGFNTNGEPGTYATFKVGYSGMGWADGLAWFTVGKERDAQTLPGDGVAIAPGQSLIGAFWCQDTGKRGNNGRGGVFLILYVDWSPSVPPAQIMGGEIWQ